MLTGNIWHKRTDSVFTSFKAFIVVAVVLNLSFEAFVPHCIALLGAGKLRDELGCWYLREGNRQRRNSQPISPALLMILGVWKTERESWLQDSRTERKIELCVAKLP